MRLRWTPGLRQPEQSQSTVRRSCVDIEADAAAEWRRLVKRTRALLESNPSGITGWKLIHCDGRGHELRHSIRLGLLVSRAHKGACPQLLLFVIPAVKLARTYLQLPCQPRHWLPHLHATYRRQLKFPGKPPFRHTSPPSLNSIGELVVSKLGSTPLPLCPLCLCGESNFDITSRSGMP